LVKNRDACIPGGFGKNWRRAAMRTSLQRVFDLVLALILAVPALPVAAAIALVVLVRDGRPVFYAGERMRAPGRPFRLWKFRTMTAAGEDGGVSGGDKAARVTRTGRWLRATRLDEVPQLWNILKGDIGFVGPRPPLREYVERYPDLYGSVLRSRPGLTGLATLRIAGYESRILSATRDASETDAIYVRRCIPKKARLDLIYQRHRSMCFDLKLIAETAVALAARLVRRGR
jgi:lipopolysaccharide/colanic/teichoic acid biosynthesis glycosyltransferase